MSFFLAAIGTLGYYLLFIGWMDRRTSAAWEVRDNYRLLSMGLVFVLILVLCKAIQWHTELVTLLPYCK